MKEYKVILYTDKGKRTHFTYVIFANDSTEARSAAIDRLENSFGEQFSQRERDEMFARAYYKIVR